MDSEPDEGTTFQVLLPRLTEAPPDEPPESDDSVIDERGGVVLVAEDEAAVRSVARRILEHAGYTVLEAADGQEALERVEQDGGMIDLLLSDVVMPGLGGIELHRRLADEHPDLEVVLMSGYSEAEVRQDMQESVPILPNRSPPTACVGTSPRPWRRGDLPSVRHPPPYGALLDRHLVVDRPVPSSLSLRSSVGWVCPPSSPWVC